MAEVFKPRENMIYNKNCQQWECLDEYGHHICDGGPSNIWGNGHSWEFYIYRIGYHRLDGPARSTGAWYFNGKYVTDEIYQFAKENNINLDNLTDVDKVMIALRFG